MSASFTFASPSALSREASWYACWAAVASSCNHAESKALDMCEDFLMRSRARSYGGSKAGSQLSETRSVVRASQILGGPDELKLPRSAPLKGVCSLPAGASTAALPPRSSSRNEFLACSSAANLFTALATASKSFAWPCNPDRAPTTMWRRNVIFRDRPPHRSGHRLLLRAARAATICCAHALATELKRAFQRPIDHPAGFAPMLLLRTSVHCDFHLLQNALQRW